MNKLLKQFLFWTPWILGILFAAFLSLFALDVFGEGKRFWETASALLMHLIPALIVLGVLLIACHWEAVGGILLIALGALFLVATWGRFDWVAYVVIVGPLFLLGGLILTDRACQTRGRSSM
jgi:hypothetical protein